MNLSFLISQQRIGCEHTVGASNEYQQRTFLLRNKKNLYLAIHLIYCAFDIFRKVVFCLALYTEEVNLQIFGMI